MTALVRMRLTAFLRSGRALPGLLGTLVVVGIIYGGGKSDAAEAYGFSAVALFPVIAWQAKLVLDTEPDVQRRLAVSAVGLRREIVAGLAAGRPRRPCHGCVGDGVAVGGGWDHWAWRDRARAVGACRLPRRCGGARGFGQSADHPVDPVRGGCSGNRVGAGDGAGARRLCGALVGSAVDGCCPASGRAARQRQRRGVDRAGSAVGRRGRAGLRAAQAYP